MKVSYTVPYIRRHTIKKRPLGHFPPRTTNRRVFWYEAFISWMPSFSCTCNYDNCDNKYWKTVNLAIIVSIFVWGASLCLFSVGHVGFYSVQKRQNGWPACYADLGNMLQGNLPTLSKCQTIKRIKCLILQEKIGAECLNFGLLKRRSYCILNNLKPCWSRVHTSGCWNSLFFLTKLRRTGVFVSIKRGFQGQRSNY